jgi:hypothetical protein
MGPAHVENVVDVACRTALSYRGVAHITFPVDLQSMPAERKGSKHNVPFHSWEGSAISARLPAGEDIERAADILNAGKKVVILAGRGALHATAELEQIAEQLAAPVSPPELVVVCTCAGAPLVVDEGTCLCAYALSPERLPRALELHLGEARRRPRGRATATDALRALAGDESGGLRLPPRSRVLVQRAGRSGLVEPPHDLAVPFRDGRRVAFLGGLTQPAHQRLRGRAPAQVLLALTRGTADALLLLLDVRHTRAKARGAGAGMVAATEGTDSGTAPADPTGRLPMLRS